MASELYNNVTDNLALSVSPGDTTITVSNGSVFTDPGSGNYFPLYVIQSGGAFEIMHVTGASGNILSVDRAQEGTNPISFAGNDTVQIRPTRQSLREFQGTVDTPTGAEQLIGDALSERVIHLNTVADLSSLTPNDGTAVSVGGVFFKYDGGQWENISGFVTPEIYGAGAPGSDPDRDNQPLEDAILSGHEVLADGEYLISDLSVSVSGAKIRGSGRLVTSEKGLALVGDGNKVQGLSIGDSEKPSIDETDYLNYGLLLYGDRNLAESLDIFNMKSSAINISGRFNMVKSCRLRDSGMGAIVDNRCRDTLFADCEIVDNNVVTGLITESGADGILSQRSSCRLTVVNTVIEGSSEHGLYFQGQGLNFIGGYVKNNGRDGLKFGSYDDGLFEYEPGELDKWVDGTGFGVEDVVIDGVHIEDNGGDDAIYFQPSARRVKISNCICKNGSVTVTYFNYTGGQARLEDHYDISLLNVGVYGDLPSGGKAGISVAASREIRIVDCQCPEGRIRNYAPNATTAPRLSSTSFSPVISGCTAGEVELSRATEGVVDSCVMDSFKDNPNNTSCYVVGCLIKDQRPMSEYEIISSSSMRSFSRNTVRYTHNEKLVDLTSGFPNMFESNTIEAPSYSGSFLIESTTSGGPTPRGFSFSDNKVFAPSANRFARLGGVGGVISGNSVEISGDLAFDVFSDNTVISSNTSIGATSCVSNDGTGNVVSANAPDDVTP